MDRILNTDGQNKIGKGRIFVGAPINGFADKVFVIDLDNLPNPYNPLNLPDYTIRLLFRDGVTPNFYRGTGVQVSSSPNVWDLTYNSSDWGQLLTQQIDLLEVLGANTNGVYKMYNLFSECSNLRRVALFDTSTSTNFSQMFNYCHSLTNVPKYDISNATDISYMFCGCTNLTTIPLFDTHNVTDISGLFYDCKNLNYVPLLDTSNVIQMHDMFNNCISLTTIPLFDTSNVENMQWMFHNCKFTTVPLFNTENVINMAEMFYDCSNLTTVPLFNTSNVENMESMFCECTSLITLPLLDTSKVTNVNDMFNHCDNAENNILAIYQQMANQTNPPVNHSSTFYSCGADTPQVQEQLDQIPPDWRGINQIQ